jgi:hypothetical protein
LGIDAPLDFTVVSLGHYRLYLFNEFLLNCAFVEHEAVMEKSNEKSANVPPEAESLVKSVWEKPEITDFKPVTVARGIAFRIGDGISNLS